MKTRIPEILEKFENELLVEWLREQAAAGGVRKNLMTDAELRTLSTQFLRALRDAARADPRLDVSGAPWANVRELLSEISASRARVGSSPAETAMFVFSLKQPLFHRLYKLSEGHADKLRDDVWAATVLLDRLGMYTAEAHQKTREEVIARQQAEMLELSTPVVQLWHGILCLPVIGTLDSRRTQSAMEALLQRIVETGSEVAIIDITGVPTVDTLTAQHLLKTITATRLMGAECILSGIRPQIAQTIVHLGVDLGNVLTKASLAAALELALVRRGLTIAKNGASIAPRALS